MTSILIANQSSVSRTFLYRFIPLSGSQFFSSLLAGPVGFFSNQFLFPFAAKFNFPRFKRFIVDHIPYKRARDLVEVVDHMYQTSIEIIESKKKALASLDPGVSAEMMNKKDIISILSRWPSPRCNSSSDLLYTSASQRSSFSGRSAH